MRRIILALLLLTGNLWAAASEMDMRTARELIVKWRSLPSHLDALDLPRELTCRIESTSRALPITERTSVGLERISVLTVQTTDDVSAILNALRADPRVEYAELRPLRWTHGFLDARDRESLDGVPNDPFYSHQWGLQAIEAEAAWNITRGDPSVVIAVVDGGVDFGHPELTHARWQNDAELSGLAGVDDDGNGFVDDFYGYDFMDQDGDPAPFPLTIEQSHGTHVSGIAVAARNNGEGIAGIAPDCRIMSVRAGNGSTIPYGIEGIYYAAHSGARIINCSWGGGSESAYERDIIHDALDRGCIVVASAGNDNLSEPKFPAAIEGVLSVAATRIGDGAAHFTNYGPWVRISAPGVHMMSCVTLTGDLRSYANWQGTSFSAPVVAAGCALVASRWPQMSNQGIIARVLSSSDPIDALNSGYSGGLGMGRINLWRALTDSVEGVRLTSVEYDEVSGNGDNRIRAGESAQLRFAVQNDLSDAGNVVGYISSADNNVVISTPAAVFGSVPSGGPHWSTSPVTVTLPANERRGYFLPLEINFVGSFGHLVGRATAVVYLDSSFLNVDNGRLALGFADNGCLGYYDYVRDVYIGAGFRLTGGVNALYHGSFVLAADGVVLDNAYGDSSRKRMDWVVSPDSIARLIPSARADIEVTAAFEEAPDLSLIDGLFATVQANALAWRGESGNRFIIIEYRVGNRSANAWAETYTGFFLDWDLAASSQNLASYDSVSATAYVRQTLPGYPLAGITAMTDPWSSFYTISNRAELDTSGWDDARKWDILRGGFVAPPTEPKDISFFMGAGPFRLEGLEERTVAFALIEGDNLENLRALSTAARQHYSQRKIISLEQPERRASARLAPNPLPSGQRLRVVLPQEERADVRIFNLLGQMVAEYSNVVAGPNGGVLDARELNGASGLLFYRIESPSVHTSGKILLLK